MQYHRVLPLFLCLLLLFSACTAQPKQTTAAPENSPEDPVLAAAETYRSIYMDVYSGGQQAVSFTDEIMTEVLTCLGKQGYPAVDFSNRFPMENADLVFQFLEDYAAGRSAQVAIYQICWDGGFICHDLTCADGKVSVTLTSLAWLSEGPYALPGDIPTVRYSNQYEVTEIACSADGYLDYTYAMPDNPPGSNHDGHIDTTYHLRLTSEPSSSSVTS